MMNYRVGVFGFLNLNHPEIDGNQGMYDQVIYTTLLIVSENFFIAEEKVFSCGEKGRKDAGSL